MELWLYSFPFINEAWRLVITQRDWPYDVYIGMSRKLYKLEFEILGALDLTL